MKKPTKPRRVARHGSRDGRLVAGHAGDQRRSRDAVRVELSDPAIGERVRRARLVPLQLAAEMLDGVCAAALAGEAGEELMEKKWQ